MIHLLDQVFFFILKDSHEDVTVLSQPKVQSEERVLILPNLLVLSVGSLELNESIDKFLLITNGMLPNLSLEFFLLFSYHEQLVLQAIVDLGECVV